MQTSFTLRHEHGPKGPLWAWPPNGRCPQEGPSRVWSSNDNVQSWAAKATPGSRRGTATEPPCIRCGTSGEPWGNRRDRQGGPDHVYIRTFRAWSLKGPGPVYPCKTHQLKPRGVMPGVQGRRPNAHV